MRNLRLRNMIKMLKTITASKDKFGVKLQEYIENQEYEVYDDLKKIFLQEGWATEILINKQEVKIENQELKLETQDLKAKNKKIKKTSE